ncbi:HEAT repeat domain-containing protein [Blastopirellula marina]|uniref:Uncharacterized protein n=1 Tax=Blastopirellula marina TaxID=124 RepID=A0A2S8GIF9_9BACT|nr:HEAT repeat domain-containing protein [Blastopirellula marina]PQO44228.1 hypothetical protein C5Y93_19890 [Blastopirellula marina]
MDRRFALLLFLLLLPGCFGSQETAQPPADKETAPVRVAKGESPDKPEKEDPLANFDPSKFSLDGDDAEKMPKGETPAEPEMPAENATDEPAATPAASGELKALVIEGAPDPSQPFSGKENEPGTQVPEEVQRLLSSYDEEDFDAVAKLVLTYPQAEVRANACERLDDMDESRGAEALLICRAALRDPDFKVRRTAANSIRWRVDQEKWNGKEAVGELVTVLSDPESGYDALMTFNKLGPDAAPAVPYLLEILKDDDSNLRSEAVLALGAIGDAAKPFTLQIMAFAKQTTNANGGRALGMLGAEKELLILLKDSDYSVREVGYAGVPKLEKPRDATVSAVLKGAAGDEWYERSSAAEALGEIRPSTPQIVDALAKLATDEQSFVRDSAYEALGNLDPPSEKAIPILVKALQKEDEGRKYAVKQALSKCKGSPEIRLQALLALAAQGDEDVYYSMTQGAKEFYPVLGQIASDPSKSVAERAAALAALPSMRNSLERDWDEVNDELEALAVKFTDKNVPDQLRGAAGVVLDECGSEREDVNELLLIAVKSDGLARIRKNAISKLGWNEYEPALPTITKIIKSQDPALLLSALQSIDEFGPTAGDAVPVIVGLKLDPDSDDYDELVTAQVRALGAIAASPELSQPLMDKLLAATDKEDYLYETILHAKAQLIAANDLDASAVLPQIVMILKNSKEPYERTRAFDMLQTLGPKAASTTGLMITYLKSGESNDRDNAVETLESFGPAAKEAGPALAEAAGTWENPWRPLSALAVIKAGGPELATVVEKLMQNLDNRERVLDTLEEIGPSAGDAVPAVVKILDSPDDWERRNAINALIGMKEASKPALPKLKELALNDPEDYVRTLASEALLKIAPDDPGVAEIVFAHLDIDDDEAVETFMADLGDNAGPFLTEKLKSDAPGVRKNALLLLSKASLPREEELKIYQAQLASDDREVKGAAAHGLMKLGERSPEVASALVASLTGEGDDWQIHQDIYHCERQAKPAVVALILNSEASPALRRDAVTLLRDSFDPPSDAGLKPLYAALDGEDELQQMWSAITLARLGDRNAKVLKSLIVASQQEGELREMAIERLGDFTEKDGELQQQAQETLLSLLKSDDEDAVQNAIYSLRYEPLKSAVIAKLAAMLPDEKTKYSVIEILSTLEGPHQLDQAAFDLLTAELKNEDEEIADSAGRTLIASGPSGLNALTTALAAADSGISPDVQSAALLAICERSVESEQPLKLPDASIAKLQEMVAGGEGKGATAAAVVLAIADAKEVKLGPALLRGFDWEDYSLRDYASRAIEKRESEADFLIPQLSERVQNVTDEEKKAYFAGALSKLGKDSPEASAAIIAVLLDYEHGYEQQEIASKLSDAALKILMDKLGETEDAEQKSRALWAFYEAVRYRRSQKEKIAVPDMVREAVKDEDQQVALPAALILAQLDPTSADSVQPLLTAVTGDDVEWEAFEGLRKLGAVAAPAVPKLTELLESSDHRANVIQVLGEIGPAAAPAVPPIAKFLADRDLRYQAVQALQKIGPAASEAQEALNAQLHGAENLSSLAGALIAIKAPTEQLIAEYQRRLEDPYQKYDALSELQAIEKVTPIAPYLTKALKSDDVEFQVTAAGVITYLDEQDPAYLEPLLAHVDDKNKTVASAMIRAAAKQPNSADKMLPILTRKLAENDEDLQYSVIQSIGDYGEAAKDLVPPLSKLVTDETWGYNAIDTLGKIGPPAAAAVPQLQAVLLSPEVLADENKWRVTQRHWSAITTLGKIGPASKPALPRLLELYGAAEEDRGKERIAETIWQIDAQTAQQAGVEPPPKKEKED